MIEHLDQIYSSPGGVPLRCDLFRPDHAEPCPLIVCLHGGGWVSGDKSEMREVASRLTDSGYVAACPAYRLAPLYPFPAALQDLGEFLTWAKGQGPELGIQADAIGVLGISVGAYMASMLGVTAPGGRNGLDASKPAVQAVASISGISDLTRPREQHFPVCWSLIEQYMGEPYEGHEDLYEQASPIFHVSRDAAPFMLVHGQADDIVAPVQGETFALALRDEGIPTEMHLLPGEGHTLSPEAWENTEKLLLQFFNLRLRNEF